MVIGGAAVADMFPKERRGRPMAIYSTGPFLGLTIGPIFGGLIEFYSNWRWIFWSLSIAAAALSFCTIAILRETHLPTISCHMGIPYSGVLREALGNVMSADGPRPIRSGIYWMSSSRPSSPLSASPSRPYLFSYSSLATLYSLES